MPPSTRILPEHRDCRRICWSDLIDDADAERADDRADDVADAADDHGHEAVDDVVLAEAGPTLPIWREERAGQSGEAAAEGEGEHVHPLGAHAHAGGHLAVLHDGADEQAERGFGQEQVRAEDDDDGEADDEDAVPAEDDVVDRPVAAEPARAESTCTLFAPKMRRKSCCRTSETPQVASSDSSGRR